MGKELDTIRAGIAAIEGLKAIYQPLEFSGDALTALANLESMRLSLEPKVKALKEEKAGIEAEVARSKDNLAMAIKDAQEVVTANLAFATQHLADAKEKADAEAKDYKDNLVAAFSELLTKVAYAKDEVFILEDKKIVVEAEISDLATKRELVKNELDSLTNQVEQLKSKLRQMAGL